MGPAGSTAKLCTVIAACFFCLCLCLCVCECVLSVSVCVFPQALWKPVWGLKLSDESRDESLPTSQPLQWTAPITTREPQAYSHAQWSVYRQGTTVVNENGATSQRITITLARGAQNSVPKEELKFSTQRGERVLDLHAISRF